MYEYKGLVVNVVDGDTCDILIDLGFYIGVQLRLRVLNIDTPELRVKDDAHREHGKAAKVRAEQLLLDTEVIIRTHKKKGKYGRYLADIILPDGRNYVSIMREEGFEKKTAY